MYFNSDIETIPCLKVTSPGSYKPGVKFIDDGLTPRVEIDLPAFRKEKNLPLSISAQEALGYAISFINDYDQKRVDIRCGNPTSTCWGGVRYTPEAVQVQKDLQYLTNAAVSTIQTSAGKTISVSKFNDPGNGNPVVSYKVIPEKDIQQF